MLYSFKCQKCHAATAVNQGDFERFLGPDELEKAKELEKDPTVKVLVLEFQKGCPTCLPGDKHPVVRLMAGKLKKSKAS